MTKTETTVGADTVVTFTIPAGSTDSGTTTWTVPSGVTSIRYLVVGGGGSGGARDSNELGGGGGGGGGVLSATVSGVAAGQIFNVTVGAGAAGVTGSKPGNKGDNSSLVCSAASVNVVAIGGGAGGQYGEAGGVGGCGGGGGGRNGGDSIAYSGGAGTDGQGFAGGAGWDFASGGGGGAGGVGGKASSVHNGGDGGPGFESDITGETHYYGAGGAGSASTKNSTTGTDGKAATEGAGVGENGTNGLGAGGGGQTVTSKTASGAGGSGVVIIRYSAGTPGPTPTGSAVVPHFGKDRGAYYAVGSEQYAEQLTTRISLGCWFKLRYGSTGGDFDAMVSLCGRNNRNGPMTLYCNYASTAANRGIGVFVPNSGNTDVVCLFRNGDFKDGKWHYIMATYDAISGDLALYVDGVKSEKGAASKRAGLLLGTGRVNIGRDAGGAANRAFDGSVARVSLWNKVLTDAEAATEYNRKVSKTSLSGNESNLIGYWPCEDETTAQTSWTGTIADAQTTLSSKHNLSATTIDWVTDTDYPFAKSSKTLSLTLSETEKTYDAQAVDIASLATVKCMEGETETTLTEDQYTLSYKRGSSDTSDFKSAGAITVTATGKTGTDYEGLTATATYTIKQATVTALAVSPTEFNHVGGLMQGPTISSVTAGGKTWTAAQLTEGTDYTKSGTWSAEAVNTYTATVTGNGNFTGSASVTWLIREYTCPHEHTTESPAVAPTCEQPGCTKKITCDDCHKVLEGGEEIPALGHDWTDWYVTKEPTIDEQGEEQRDCRRSGCGAIETRVLPTIGWTFYPEAISGQRDGIISNSVGQILNVYFRDDGTGTNLVIGTKVTTVSACKAVNADSTRTYSTIDLTGGVKDGTDAERLYGIVEIGKAAFNSWGLSGDGDQFIREVVLPDELEAIADYAFACNGGGANGTYSILESVVYSGTRLKTIGYRAFCSAQILGSSVQSFFPASLESIGNEAFAMCYKISGSVNTHNLTTIPYRAFQHCDSLAGGYFPKVTEVVNSSFDTAFYGPVSFKFGTDQVVLNGTTTFSWTWYMGECMMRFLFPGAAPKMEESAGPVISTRNGRWKYDVGKTTERLTKRAYFILDKSMKENEDWKKLRTYSSINVPTTLPGHTVDIDTSVNSVTTAEIASDLGLSESEVDIYGVYVPSTDTDVGNVRYPIILVAVDSAYFDETQDYTWANPAGGDWKAIGNWMPDDGYPHTSKASALFNQNWANPLTVTADQNYTVGAIRFSLSAPVTLDFGGHWLRGPGGESVVGFPLSADQTSLTFANGTFAFTNSWFSGDDKALTVTEGATVSFTGDGNLTGRRSGTTSNKDPLDFVWVHPSKSGGSVLYEVTYPNVAVTDGGSLTVASPAGTTLANFMLDSVWGHGLVDGGMLAYANNDSVANTMTFKDGLVVKNGGSVTGASTLVIKGGETDIAAGSTVDFTSLSVEGPAKGVIAAAGGTLGVTLTSAATGADLTFAGITLGDVTGQASQTRLTFANGAVGSGALSYSGKSNCTNVFDGGAFTVPSGKTFALGTTPTLAFVLPETGFASAPLTVQASGAALANDTVIVIDGAKFKGTTYESGLVPLVKMPSAIGNLETLKLNATGIPSGMQLALAPDDSTLLVLAPDGCTVTFNANGGMPPEQTKGYGYNAQYGEFPTVTRSGYKFVGWYTQIEGGVRKYTSDRVTSDHTLYAHWEKSGLILFFGPAN